MEPKSVDVAEVIENQGIGRLQSSTIALCGMVTILDGFDNQSIAFVAPLVARELGATMSSFGPIFGAGLFGLMLGTLAFGPLADRVGRKPVIVFCVAIFGLLTLLTPLADSLRSIAVLRFLAGVGLGGALPNVIALTSEYAPRARRATLVSLMFCGVPLGAVLGGLASSELMLRFGWRSVFYTGGIMPLLLVGALLVWLPESLQFLVAQGASVGRVLPLLRRLDPTVPYSDATVFKRHLAQTPGLPVSRLFSDGRALVTSLLWLTFFCNLLVMFFLISWLPSILHEAGAPLERSALATVILNVGGMVGGLALGRMVDRRSSYGFVAAAYAVGAIMTALLGVTAHMTIPLFLLNIFATGILILGLQFCTNAIAASYYPTDLRSTGIGWALGVGRTGSVIGPTLGGTLIARGWSTEQLFTAAALPALLAAISMALINLRIRRPAPLDGDHQSARPRPTKADLAGACRTEGAPATHSIDRRPKPSPDIGRTS